MSVETKRREILQMLEKGSITACINIENIPDKRYIKIYLIAPI